MLDRNPSLSNDLDPDGRSPLHHACKDGFMNLIEVLLDHGSNIVTSNIENGKTPLDEAFTYQASQDYNQYSTQIIALIEAKVDEINLKNEAESKSFIHVEDLYYKKPLFKEYMIPVSNVRDLNDYVYLLFEVDNKF